MAAMKRIIVILATILVFAALSATAVAVTTQERHRMLAAIEQSDPNIARLHCRITDVHVSRFPRWASVTLSPPCEGSPLLLTRAELPDGHFLRWVVLSPHEEIFPFAMQSCGRAVPRRVLEESALGFDATHCRPIEVQSGDGVLEAPPAIIAGVWWPHQYSARVEAGNAETLFSGIIWVEIRDGDLWGTAYRTRAVSGSRRLVVLRMSDPHPTCNGASRFAKLEAFSGHPIRLIEVVTWKDECSPPLEWSRVEEK